jgi:ribose transport system permease protein
MSASTLASRPAEEPFARIGHAIARAGFLPLLLVLIIIAMSIAVPNFYGVINILNILRNASFLAVVACGQALVLIAGGFDPLSAQSSR